MRTYDDDGWDPNFLDCVKRAGEVELDSATQDAMKLADDVTGAAMVVRHSMLRDTGLFDPIFGSYYEDYDFCQRARRAGWQVGYLPGARVQHYSGSATTTPAAHRKREIQILRNRVIARVRKTDQRLNTLLTHVVRDLPRNLLRGLLRTPSSQPVTSTLRAQWRLLALLPRLLSARHDRECWLTHLESIGWGEALSAEPPLADAPLEQTHKGL